MALTTTQKDRLNNDFNPTAQAAGLGDALFAAPVIFEYTVAADASTAVAAFTAPFAMRIAFISVRCTAANASGTLVPEKGTTAMCTGITCAVDLVVTNWSAGVVAAEILLAAGDVVSVKSVGGTTANTRGVITFIGVRL